MGWLSDTQGTMDPRCAKDTFTTGGRRVTVVDTQLVDLGYIDQTRDEYVLNQQSSDYATRRSASVAGRVRQYVWVDIGFTCPSLSVFDDTTYGGSQPYIRGTLVGVPKGYQTFTPPAAGAALSFSSPQRIGDVDDLGAIDIAVTDVEDHTGTIDDQLDACLVFKDRLIKCFVVGDQLSMIDSSNVKSVVYPTATTSSDVVGLANVRGWINTEFTAPGWSVQGSILTLRWEDDVETPDVNEKRQHGIAKGSKIQLYEWNGAQSDLSAILSLNGGSGIFTVLDAGEFYLSIDIGIEYWTAVKRNHAVLPFTGDGCDNFDGTKYATDLNGPNARPLCDRAEPLNGLLSGREPMCLARDNYVGSKMPIEPTHDRLRRCARWHRQDRLSSQHGHRHHGGRHRAAQRPCRPCQLHARPLAVDERPACMGQRHGPRPAQRRLVPVGQQRDLRGHTYITSAALLLAGNLRWRWRITSTGRSLVQLPPSRLRRRNRLRPERRSVLAGAVWVASKTATTGGALFVEHQLLGRRQGGGHVWGLRGHHASVHPRHR